MTSQFSKPAIYDLAVVGAGPAGLACGLAAATLGLDVAVIGPCSGREDGRTAALFQASAALLENLGVWSEFRRSAEPLVAIRIVDATGALLRVPEVTFEAQEIGLDAFGYNVPNAALTAALEQASAGRVHRVDANVVGTELAADSVRLSTSNGEAVSARLVGAADGRMSPTRAAAGIETAAWSYDQAAIVTTFAHSRPHRGVSTEFHRNSGPLTVVPGLGRTSSLVWVETRDEAQRLAALDDAAFSAALRTFVGSLLGDISKLEPRRLFPLSGHTANAMAKNRVALIGEAAHVIPPIGAQGLNLSLRDAATLATLAAEAVNIGRDPGSIDVLDQYHSMRERDVRPRVIGVDLLNRSLLSDLAPVQLARGFGIYALASFSPLRRLVMREGVAPTNGLPDIMRFGASVVPPQPKSA
jgi:2-octaprenyl-6-methoxyphenol hydroxylase